MLKTLRSRFALAGVTFVAVGLLAAGCGSSVSSFAYSVNGDEVSQSDFNRELDALADNEAFAEAYETQMGFPIRDSEGTISTAFAAQWMTVVINAEIMSDAVEDDDIEITDEIREEAETEAPALFVFGQPDGGTAIWEDFPEWFREDVIDRLAAQLALLDSVTPEVTDEMIRQTYDEQVPAVAEACASGKFVSHLIVETEEEANNLRAELDAGADFLELTLEHSTDPGLADNQGFYDCFTEGSGMVAEFEAGVNATAVGEISPPVQTEFGWHLIKVDAQPPFEVVEDLLRQGLGQPDQAALTAILEEADVEVDDKYGEWVVEQGRGQVVPPEDESDEVPTQGQQPGDGGQAPIDLENIDPELLEQIQQQLPEGTEDIQVQDPQGQTAP